MTPTKQVTDKQQPEEKTVYGLCCVTDNIIGQRENHIGETSANCTIF
jgi:hypothetical protein